MKDISGTPMWKSRDILFLPIKGSIVEAAFAGNLSITLSSPPPLPLKQKLVDVSSRLSLRISDPGTYSLRVVSPLSADSVTTSELFTIVDCDNSGSAPSELLSPSSSSLLSSTFSSVQLNKSTDGVKPIPAPIFRVPSKISLPGNRPFKVPPTYLPTSSSPVTISFWAWMERDTSDALNVYRTLFYKGDPDAKTMERTPSAFITPLPQRNSALSLDPGGDQEALDEVTPPNPLLLQLSTGSQADVGAESKRGIEVDRFNHLVFILSAGTYQLFIDGELDSKLQFDDPIIHNDHSLMLGYAPGMNGPKMIMSDLKVWASELSPDEVKKIWTREAGRHSTVGTLKPTTSDRKSLAIWPPSGIPQKHVESTRESTLATLSSIRERECGGDVRERLMLWEEAANC